MHTLEEMHWLLLLSGYFVADNPRGESASPPMPLIHPAVYVDGSGDPLVALINLVLSLADFQNTLLTKEGGKAIWSPLLGETILWMLTRWSHSYLLYKQEIRNTRQSMLDAWGFGTDGAISTLDFLFKTACLALTNYDGETDVQDAACELLAALASRKLPANLIGNMRTLLFLLPSISLLINL